MMARGTPFHQAMSTATNFYTVTLRIYHDSCPPDEISARLQRPADTAGVKGAQRGTSESRATWPWHYWVAEFKNADDVDERIERAVAFIKEREVELSALLKSGGRAEIIAFVAPATGVGFLLQPEALATMARLGVGLGLDIYAQKPSSPMEDE